MDEKEQEKTGGPVRSGLGRKTALVGASVGIGSAAIVAALLYTSRMKSQKRRDRDPAD